MALSISGTASSCQQRRFWTVERPLISVAAMTTKLSNDAAKRKAKPSKSDLDAARRLKIFWDEAVALSKADPASDRLTQEVAAAELGSGQSAVSQYLNGTIPLNYRALLVFARLVGRDPSEIRDDLPEQQHLPKTGSDGYWSDVLAYAQAVGLGAGTEAQEYAETHALKFRAASLQRKRLNPAKLAVYYGDGDSMQPRIRKGDAILFDTSDVRPVDGAIFIVEWRGEVYAKRCEILDGEPWWRSDNPAGDHAWTKPKRGNDPKAPVSVLGRVRWLGSWED